MTVTAAVFVFSLCLMFAVSQDSSGIYFEDFNEAKMKLKNSQSIWDYSMPRSQEADRQQTGQNQGKNVDNFDKDTERQNSREISSKEEDKGKRRYLKGQQDNNKQSIREKIFSWYSSGEIGSQFHSINAQIGDRIMMEDNTEICRLYVHDFSRPTIDLLNVDNSVDVLSIGQFIQSKYVSVGTESLVRVPISDNKRQPITIGSTGNTKTVTAASSSPQDVNYAIKQELLNAKGYSSGKVLIDFRTSEEITQIITQFNFNAKILQKLDISGGFNGSWQTKKNKFVLTLIQGLASFYPSMHISDDKDINDPVGAFLKSSFTLKELQDLQRLGYTGRTNPPLYVSQINYGRLMIISVDKNQYTQNIYASLKASNPKFDTSLSVKMTKMFQDSSVKVFSVGPFSGVEVKQLKTGEWTNFFKQMPANSSVIQALHPISFKLRDFKMRPVLVSNYLQYDTIKCEVKPSNTIMLRITDIFNYADVYLKKTGENSFSHHILNSYSSSPVLDLSKLLSNGANDEIRVTNKGGRKRWYKPWQRSVRLQIWVNGKLVFNQRKDCRWCHSTSNAFTCSVNKYASASSAVRCY